MRWYVSDGENLVAIDDGDSSSRSGIDAEDDHAAYPRVYFVADGIPSLATTPRKDFQLATVIVKFFDDVVEFCRLFLVFGALDALDRVEQLLFIRSARTFSRD
jgi:hypothetical protein